MKRVCRRECLNVVWGVPSEVSQAPDLLADRAQGLLYWLRRQWATNWRPWRERI